MSFIRSKLFFVIALIGIALLSLIVVVQKRKSVQHSEIEINAQQDNPDYKDSFFEPIYSKAYDDEYLEKCMDIDNNVEDYYNRDTLSMHIKGCPCVPLSNLDNKDSLSIICVSDWASNPADLWIIIQNKKNSEWSKPILSGIILSGNRSLYLLDKLLIDIAHMNLSNAQKDTDNDGLTDILEARFGTSPVRPDTDDDGIVDLYDTNPTASLTYNCSESDMYSAVFNNMEKHNAGPVYVVNYPSLENRPQNLESRCTIKHADALILQTAGKGMKYYATVTFSKPDITSSENATIRADYDCGPLCGYLSLYSLRRISKEWKAIGEDVEIIR